MGLFWDTVLDLKRDPNKKIHGEDFWEMRLLSRLAFPVFRWKALGYSPKAGVWKTTIYFFPFGAANWHYFQG